jgi:hypothetical protein
MFGGYEAPRLVKQGGILMEAFRNEFMQVIGERLPDLIGAVLVLVIGWLLALAVATIVRGLFERLGINKFLVTWIAGDVKDKKLEPGKWIAKGVYYFLMIVVLGGFFQFLELTIVTEPLAQIVTVVAEFAPRILIASLLLLLALVLARFVKMCVSKGLILINADERLGESTGKRSKPVKLSHTVSNVAYSLVFLLFLPTILDALALESLLLPVQSMIQEILGFLPNLFACGLILLVGWFAAQVGQQIISNALAAAGVDNVTDKAGLENVVGKQTLSELIGTVIYILIFIPVAIAALDALQVAAISEPASRMLIKIFNAIPSIATALFVLLVAYVGGRFVSGLVTELLTRLGFNTILVSLGLSKNGKKAQRTPSEVVGSLSMIAIMLFAIIEAARMIGFRVLALQLNEFIAFAGQVMLGLIIFGFGLYLANLASKVISERNASQSGVLAMAAKISIVVLASAMALRQMGLAHEIISLAFGMLLGSIAVAVALAFGLGARDIASREVENWLSSIRSGK